MNTFACNRCGQLNPANSPVCARCGMQFAAGPSVAGGPWTPPPGPYRQPADTKRSTGVIAAIVIAVIVVIGVPVAGIVAAIVIPSVIRARSAANEAAAIGALRSLGNAEAAYQSRYGKFGTIPQLISEDLVDPSFVTEAKRKGYAIREVKVSDRNFEFSAVASEEVTSGPSSFNITEDFIIRYREGIVAPAGKSGTPIG